MEVWSNGVRDFQVELLKYPPQHSNTPHRSLSVQRPIQPPSTRSTEPCT